MSEPFVKKLYNCDAKLELEYIGFDSSYVYAAKDKYENQTIKVYNLRCEEALILKQSALSLGFDCAIHREVLTHKVELSDCLMSASIAQYRKLAKKLKAQPFKLKKVAFMIEESLGIELLPLKIRNKYFDWNKNVYVMGILNVTPDSFSDGGDFLSADDALNHAILMLEQGTDIIDIGAESTRPGHSATPQDVEIERILPIIKAIRNINSEVILSIDTRNALTAKTALELGVDIVNDISALEHDKSMLGVVKQANCPVVLMHSAPRRNMPIVEDVYTYFVDKLAKLQEKGLERQNLIIDIGIGFNKTVDENFELIKRYKEFYSLAQPSLIGVSRKSFITKSVQVAFEERDALTNVFTPALISANVGILRVHNVSLAKKAIELAKKLN